MLQFNMFTVIEALQPLTNMMVNLFRDRQKIVYQHEQLYQALCDQGADKAKRALDELMQVSLTVVKENISHE